MPAILQRVLSASVTVDKEVVSSIGKGVLVFAAMAPGDTEKEAESLAAKVLKMKLWGDDAGGQVCMHILPYRLEPRHSRRSTCSGILTAFVPVEEKRAGYRR